MCAQKVSSEGLVRQSGKRIKKIAKYRIEFLSLELKGQINSESDLIVYINVKQPLGKIPLKKLTNFGTSTLTFLFN